MFAEVDLPTTEPLADWERELLVSRAIVLGDEPVAWSSEIDGEHRFDNASAHLLECVECDNISREVEQDDEREDEFDFLFGESGFLPTMSLAEVYHHLGDGGWHIESQGGVRTPVGTGAYLRVYDLARELGYTSKEMVERLRLMGEYVATASSIVAMPVADFCRAYGRPCQDTSAAKVETPQPDLNTLRDSLSRQAVASRPGAPRPGNNHLYSLPRPWAPEAKEAIA